MFLNLILIIVYIFIMFGLTAIAFKMRENKKEVAVVVLMFFSFSMLFFLLYEIIINATLFLIFIALYTFIIIKIGKKNYTDLQIKDLQFISEKIVEDITVLFIADFQYDKNDHSFNQEAFNLLIEKINTLKYDVILFGGDYINYKNYFSTFAKGIQKIENKNNAYAVMGNHDFFIKEELIDLFENMDIKVLENELNIVDIKSTKLDISGIKDMWYDKPSYEIIKNQHNKENFHIFISHNPDYIKEVESESIDLFLSGHYHKGQVNVIPKVTLARLVTKYTYGLYIINNIKLFVTSGVGGSFLRGKVSSYIRWNAKPEIVRIELKSKTK